MKTARNIPAHASRRFIYGSVAAACLALLSGCAQLPDLDKGLRIKALEQYQTGSTLAGKTTAWPSDTWWRTYGDAQLDRLIAEGLKDSPNMAIAEARLRRALAMTQVTNSSTAPQLDAQIKPSLDKQSYNYLFPRAYVPQGWNDYGLATLNFSWEIDFWGKHKAALAAAISMQEAGAADVAQTRIVLATSIASAYGELARLYTLHDTAKAAVGVRTKTAELLQKRHVQGLEMLANVKQSDGRKASAEEDLLALDEQIALQKNRIATLLGAGPDRGQQITRPTLNVSQHFDVPQQMQLELLGRRPDIVAARLRVEASEQSVDKQKAEFYPNVNLSAMIGLQSLGLNTLSKSGSDFGSIGPAISLPILNGGRLRAQLRGAQAEYDEAVGNYNKAVTQALQDVADAAVSQKTLTQKITKLTQAYQAASEAHRIMKNRYQGGLASYLDVLSAEEGMLASQRALRDAQSRSFTLDVALVKALGGGYQAPVKN